MKNGQLSFQILAFVACLLFSSASFAQEKLNYIVDKEGKKAGLNLIKGLPNEKAFFVEEATGRFSRRTYTTSDILEYGFNDGQVFVRKTVLINGHLSTYFLERLSVNPPVYYLLLEGNKYFFHENTDGTLTQIDNSTTSALRSNLEPLFEECENLKGNLASVQNKRHSMNRLLSNYSSCNNTPFPILRYGLKAGKMYYTYTPAQQNKINALNYFSYQQENTFAISGFIDIPLLSSFLSIHIDPMYISTDSRYFYSREEIHLNTSGIYNYSVWTSASTLILPIQLRYIHPFKKIAPFYNAGFFIENNYSKGALYQSDSPYYSQFDIYELPDRNYGVTLGTGVQYYINRKLTVALDLKANLMMEHPNIENTLKRNEFIVQIAIGY